MSGILIVLSGPAGVGKGTILRRVAADLPNLITSVSVTTRAPRRGEVEGREYFFRTPAEFERLVEEDAFLEWASYLDCSYGTPRAWVLEQLAAGRDVVLEIEVKGAMQVRARFPEAVLVFAVPPSFAELAARLRKRATESEEMLERRLAAAREELQQVGEYDYAIINDDLERAAADLAAIVRAEHLRPRRLALPEI